MTSSWRRNADEALPARGKIVGGYVNMAFQKSEAELNGFDEAVVLTPDGHVIRGVGGQPVRGPRRRAPHAAGHRRHPRGRHPQGDHRAARADSGIPVEVRSIDRSELYVADEIFLCGTGVQVSPVIEVDHRPVGSGEIGPIAPARPRALLRRGPRARCPSTAHWLTPDRP